MIADEYHSFTAAEVQAIFHISRRKLLDLGNSRKVGFIVGKYRERFYLPEHLNQIKEQVAIKPESVELDPDADWRALGFSAGSAARRRRRSA